MAIYPGLIEGQPHQLLRTLAGPSPARLGTSSWMGGTCAAPSARVSPRASPGGSSGRRLVQLERGPQHVAGGMRVLTRAGRVERDREADG